MIIVLGFVLVLNLVIVPLALYLSACIVRIKDLTFSRICIAFLLTFAANLCLTGVSFALEMLLPHQLLLPFIILLVGLLIWLDVVIVEKILRTTGWRSIGCWFLWQALSIGAAFGVRAGAVEVYLEPFPSMSPTILSNERIAVDKVSGRFQGFHTGEIVMFRDPLNPSYSYVKRIAAVGGDRLEIRDDTLYVNSVAAGRCPLTRSYLKDVTPPEFPCTVPAGKFFMLGDNRDRSVDSRDFGFIDSQAVIGKPVIVYASATPPLDRNEQYRMRREGLNPATQPAPGTIRWSRIGTILK